MWTILFVLSHYGKEVREFLANLLKRQSPGRTGSSEQHLLDIPRTKLASFGGRNTLPIDIKCMLLLTFKISNDILENFFQIFHLNLFLHVCIDIYMCHRLVCILHVNRVLISFIYLFIYFTHRR